MEVDICSDLVNDLLEEAENYAEECRWEFFTPEILLFIISRHEDFENFCNRRFVDVVEVKKTLLSFIIQQDVVPDQEDYILMPSADMENLSALLRGYIGRGNTPLCISDILSAMSVLEGSMVQYVLSFYFDSETHEWYDDLCKAYADDMLDCPEKQTFVPSFNSENTNEEEQHEEISGEEMFSRMMASANRLMGALHSLNEMHQQEESEDEEPEEQREPWEYLVTCISDIYLSKNPLIGREKELDRCIRILCRKDKNNPLFIGEPGVGKTALIYGLARMIDEGRVPERIQNYRIYALEMSNMIAGASYHGEFEKRVKMVLEGASQKGNCIIYIDEIHTIMGSANSNGAPSGAEMLKPYLEDGRLRFIGSTTYQDYNKQMANNKAISRRFGTIDIKEPSVEETLEIAMQLRGIYENHHGVKYADEALEYAVRQSHNLIHDRFLPDKAIDIIDEAGAYLQQNPLLNKKGARKADRYQIVDKGIIKKILTEVCRIDAKALASDSNDELKGLDQRIKDKIYGQDNAVSNIVNSIMMSKAGLLDMEKPIASFLFVGPTGVGKTEICKVLSSELGIELIRFDMSEYTEKHTISKLIGAPSGYVGYDEGGLLTDAVSKSPNCVLLLDEIEKAHSDIYNILLQVMDYARLTDNKGKKVDFRNVILVMTSNAGAQFAGQAAIGFSGGISKGEAMLSTIKKTFKPEFLNRLSDVVVFNEMDETMATLILDKKIAELQKRLDTRSVVLSLSPDAKQFLLSKGYNKQYGAREMDRALSKYLNPLLMKEILFGKLSKGGSVNVQLSEDNEGLVIE